MIKSKEQFATIIMNLSMFERGASENSIYTMHIDDLIEALRNVARPADGFLDMLDTDGGNAYLPDNIDLGLLRQALDALPAWVLEE